MASRKETEEQARAAGLSDEEIKGSKTIADLEGAIAAKSSTEDNGDSGSNTDPNAGTSQDSPAKSVRNANSPEDLPAANSGGEEMKAGGGSQTGPGTDQLRGIPPTGAVIEPPAPTQDELQGNSGGKIARMTQVAWWCPNCDNSNERSLNACAKCGAKVSQDGLSVGAPQRT